MAGAGGLWLTVEGDAGLWGTIMSFVGRGEWLFVGGVSRLWRDRHGPSRRTEIRAALFTLQRLEVACAAGGLAVGGIYLGMFAGGVDVILRARELAAVRSCDDTQICNGAARGGRQALLEELHLGLGWPLSDFVGIEAATAPTPDILIWLRSIAAGGPWDDEDILQEMMRWASMHGRVENARWLRDQAGGCRVWHSLTITHAALLNQLPFISWAIGEGCDWEWSPGTCRSVRKHASAFAWLHAQEGFPCNC
jgi:hypothetical protein